MFLGSGSSPAEAQGGGQSFLKEEATWCRNSNSAFLYIRELLSYNQLFIHCSLFTPSPTHANTEESDTIAEPKEVQLKSKLIFILNSSKARCWRGFPAPPVLSTQGWD